MASLFKWFIGLFDHPIKLSLSVAGLAFLSLLTQGTLLELWNLKMEKIKMENRYHDLLQHNSTLQLKINQARNSDWFIGRQAREKLDLVKDDELVFIFENEAPILGTTTRTP